MATGERDCNCEAGAGTDCQTDTRAPGTMRSGDSWTITINGKGLDIDIDSRRKEKLGKER